MKIVVPREGPPDRHRWQEMAEVMPTTHDFDARYDRAITRNQAPRQMAAPRLVGSFGLHPDEALIQKEHNEGPVGKLGKLRPKISPFNHPEWPFLYEGPTNPNTWLQWHVFRAMQVCSKIDDIIEQSKPSKLKQKILETQIARPAGEIVPLPHANFVEQDTLEAIQTALKHDLQTQVVWLEEQLRDKP